MTREKYIHEIIQTREDIQVRFEIHENSNQLITNHWHNSMEIIYICNGDMDVTINNSAFALASGDFIIINSTDIHSTYYHENCKAVLLQIPYSFLKKCISNYDRIRFEGNYQSRQESDCERNDLTRNILLDMKEIFEQTPEGFSLKFSSLLYELLFIINQGYKVEIDTSVKMKTEKNLRRLECVMEYVKANYASPITLEAAASVVSLHPEYFCRFFKKYMGLTFLEYVNKVRLLHVQEDILHTDLSITEILSLHGCTNYKLFMRNFKETYGCTPMQLRKLSNGHKFM